MQIGLYVRVKRDDKWRSLDILELTSDEFYDFFAGKDRDTIESWLKKIVDWIKDNVKTEEG